MSTPGGSLKNAWPHLGLVLVYILWGINMSSLKIGGREWDPLIFNGLRYLGIIPFLWAYTYRYYRKHHLTLRMPGRDIIMVSILGILSALGMEAMLSYALQFSNTANGAVLGRGFMPIVTVVFSILLREIWITRRIAIGLPLAFVSVILIIAGGKVGLHFGADTLRGDVLLLLRSFMGAFYLIGMSRLISKYPLTLLVSIEMTAGALSMLPFVLWKVDAAYLSAISTAGWISLLYTAYFATMIGFSVHNWSLGRLGPFKSSFYGYLLPVTAAAAGYFLLGETLSLFQWIGGAGVLTGMYLVQRDRMQAVKPAPKDTAN